MSASSDDSQHVKVEDFKNIDPFPTKNKTSPKLPLEELSLQTNNSEKRGSKVNFLSPSPTLSGSLQKNVTLNLNSTQSTPNPSTKEKKVRTTLPPIDATPHGDYIFSDTPQKEYKLSIPELHQILTETNRRKKESVSAFPVRKRIVEDDYDEIYVSDEKQELSNVKNLEKWNLEMRKKKILTTDNIDFLKAQKQKHHDMQPNDMPRVNTQLINKIMIDDEETEARRSKFRSMNLTAEPEEEDEFNDNQNKFAFRGSLDNYIQENTRNILDDLILKKIKKYIETVDIDKTKDDQLKFQIQRITDEVLGQFRSLKIAGSVIVLQNHITKMVKKIKTKKYEYQKLFDFSKEDPEKNKSSLVDYKTAETLLIKTFEKNLEDIRKQRENISFVNNRINDLKKDMKKELSRLEDVRKKYSSLDTKEPVLSKQTYTDKVRKKTGAEKNAIDEYIKIQRQKTELKREEAQIQEKLNDLETQILRSTSELDRLEHDLRAAKNVKAHTKLQLKELYYKILKDDGELTKGDNNISYIWIIRALWKINSDVNEHAFPDFLDKESVNFLLEYARLQVELEKLCTTYHLTGFPVNPDEYKYLDALNPHKENQEEERIEQLQDNLAYYARITQKDLKSLLSDVRNRITEIKKQNLKAKRQVQVTQYTAKGRQVISKWEDVNPLDSNLPLVDFNGQPYEFASRTMEHTFDDDTSKKFNYRDSSIKLNGFSPYEKATEIANKIESMKKAEVARIIKNNIGKDNNQHLRSTMQKLFISLFGRKEGEEYYSQFLREKRAHDQRIFQNKRPIAALQEKKPIDKIAISVNLGKDTSRLITDQNSTKEKFNPEVTLTQSHAFLKTSSVNTEVTSSRNIKIES